MNYHFIKEKAVNWNRVIATVFGKNFICISNFITFDELLKHGVCTTSSCVVCIRLILFSHFPSIFSCQGAIVATIQPEYLLDRKDFMNFITIRHGDLPKAGLPMSFQSLEKEIGKYEALSKDAWTDLLLQILKVWNASFLSPKNGRTFGRSFVISLIKVSENSPLKNFDEMAVINCFLVFWPFYSINSSDASFGPSPEAFSEWRRLIYHCNLVLFLFLGIHS